MNKILKYATYHMWIRRHYGTPSYCEMCECKDKRMYHWAAKDYGEGGRNRSDWLRLCVPCHAKYDGRTGGSISEEHKRKIGIKTKITSLGNQSAKGHKLSPQKRKEISEKTKLGMLKWKMAKLAME